MTGIINYGVGNIQSVKNSLDHLGIANALIGKPGDMDKCDKIILPGVGAFAPAIEKLVSLGFSEKIEKWAQDKKPILGICLGMQLLFEEGREYGRHQGLGLLKGNVLPFSEKIKNLPLPQIGWNDIYYDKPSSLTDGIENGSSFYFIHSFYCQPANPEIVAASADYGIKFAAIVHEDNIFGCQFHPEKSQAAGLTILKNFQNI